MHYRNGREAKNGDHVVRLNDSGRIQAFGVLTDAVPGNDFCNGDIVHESGHKTYACMCDCLHVDDVAAILVEKGLGDRPQPVAAPQAASPDAGVAETQQA